MATSRKTRAALYARVSTAGHGQDVGLQLDDLRRVAAQRGWQVVHEFIDDGVSGTTEARPGLDGLMAAVRGAEVDVVMVWRFDRFARSTQHLLEALDEFRRCRVEFVSVRENIETTTALGKALFTLAAVVAELEHALIQERVQAGVARARERGVKFGRPRRGLDLRAAQALIAQGHSVREVADMLGLPRTTLRRRLAEARPVGGPEVAVAEAR
ncbi:MAG: recombinase family protein [Myxococcales bacterium]|nr:recombinase family protein [Myxococcales bacterium]